MAKALDNAFQAAEEVESLRPGFDIAVRIIAFHDEAGPYARPGVEFIFRLKGPRGVVDGGAYCFLYETARCMKREILKAIDWELDNPEASPDA